MLNFEVFAKRMVPLTKQPYVTIQRRGTISLNAAARAALGSPDAVELLFDDAERVIGIRGAAADSGHAFPLRAQGGKQSGPYLISGHAFTVYYGIDTSASRRWPGELIDDILCVDLKEPGVEVTSNRSAVSPRMVNGPNEKPKAPPPETATWPSLRPEQD